MDSQLKSVISTFRFHRRLILDVLKSLTDDQLKLTVGKKMGTLGRQFRHIGDVQLCYVDSLRTGKIDFSKKKKVRSLESSQKKLLAFLESADKELDSVLKTTKDTMKIDWGPAREGLARHFQYLVEHEVLHEGQLIVYMNTLGLKVPKSWNVWGVQ